MNIRDGNSTACPGCGNRAPDLAGPPPAELGASAACWAQYGVLLARSYGVATYRGVHQLVVDAYAAQHPGGATRREVQMVAVCLMTLCLFIEDGVDPTQGPVLHKRMVANRPEFHRLTPPPLHGLISVADVLTAKTAIEHEQLAWAWARAVWRAWEPHHTTVRAWNMTALRR